MSLLIDGDGYVRAEAFRPCRAGSSLDPWTAD
jgi:hypothetical protein